MRLPWPFGRSTAAPADTKPESGAPVPAAAPSPPASTGAWATLPPIQRAVGAAPLVASSETFFEAVPGVHPLPPIVEPLGHDVTRVAPAGLVGAPVHTVASLTSNAALVPPPVQRRPDGATVEAMSESPAPTAAADAPTPAPAPQTMAPSASVPVEPPARQLGVVKPDAAARPPAHSLTHAELPAGPTSRADAPLAGRRTQVQTSQAAAPTATSPRPDVTSTGRHAESAAVTEAGTVTPPPAARRAGLGVPLPTAPSTAVLADARPLPGLAVARLAATTPTVGDPAGSHPSTSAPGSPTATSPTAGAVPLRTTIQRRISGQRPAVAEPAPATADSSDGPDLAPARPSLSAVPSPTPTLPVLPVVGRPTPTPSDGPERSPANTSAVPSSAPASIPTGAGSGASARLAVTVARTVTTESPALPAPRPQRRPLVGSQPIGPIGAVQRQASIGGASTAPVGASATPASAQTTPSAFGGASPEASSGAIWTLAGGWERPMPTVGGDTGPAVQRQASGALHFPTASRTDRSPAWGSSGTPRRSEGAAAPMTLVRPAVPAAQAAPWQEATATPSIARSIVSEVPAPSVQTSPLAVGMVQGPVFGPTATPVVQRIDNTPPPAPETRGGSEHSDDELDQLARSLFGRLRTHLRNEYIYEREAKGLTFDQS